VCCSVLQCVATCCNVLQCVAMCCSVSQLQIICECPLWFPLQTVAVCRSLSQFYAVCRSLLQFVAACRILWQCGHSISASSLYIARQPCVGSCMYLAFIHMHSCVCEREGESVWACVCVCVCACVLHVFSMHSLLFVHKTNVFVTPPFSPFFSLQRSSQDVCVIFNVYIPP